ncbi:MAG: hypothetical protein SGARI_004307 [Bacillariaceae sp.]
MLPAVLGTALVCSFLFWIVTPSIAYQILPDGASESKRIKARCQVTNFCFNLCIGSMGVYYHLHVLPTLESHYFPNVIDRIPGHANLYLFSAMQLGYQLWALPVGLVIVKEPAEMIMHHCAVVLASTMSGFSYCGFRYFSIYFYGLMELSSIPLAIMNLFKDNRESMDRHPFLFLLTKAAFSFSFLYFRIYMWFYIGPTFLMHDFFLFWTVEMGIEKVFLLMQFSMGVCLALLQMYWAVLVSKGIISFLLPKRKEKLAAMNGHATNKDKAS